VNCLSACSNIHIFASISEQYVAVSDISGEVCFLHTANCVILSYSQKFTGQSGSCKLSMISCL